MLKFVNAKINLGLNITERRPDGYHNLETIFLPVGLKAGTPENPAVFNDILEIVPAPETEYIFTGEQPDCPVDEQLPVRAHRLFCRELGREVPVRLILEKHLPFGAGMGGGSADASFTLRILNELTDRPFSDSELAGMALKLGADCPVFIYNEPLYAEGVGEIFTPVPDLREKLDGMWVAVLKPEVCVSTREAFAGIKPRRPEENLLDIARLPVSEWRGRMRNDFEETLFPLHRELPALKRRLYDCGAEFALMTGSGSAVFGLFPSEPDRDLIESKPMSGLKCFYLKV